MSAARVEQRNMSEDEQIMWDELKVMKRNYYGPLFCGPWKWYNSSWRSTWCAYMEHWRNFEAAYYRLMTQQSVREKNARKDAATPAEVNWWNGKLDGLLECQQRIMELYPADVRDRLNQDGLLNNYEKFTEQPHPAGWEGYYTRPTLGRQLPVAGLAVPAPELGRGVLHVRRHHPHHQGPRLRRTLLQRQVPGH